MDLLTQHCYKYIFRYHSDFEAADVNNLNRNRLVYIIT